MDKSNKNNEEVPKHEQSKDEYIEVHEVEPSTSFNLVEITDPLMNMSQNLVVLQTAQQPNQPTVPSVTQSQPNPTPINGSNSTDETFFNSIKKKLSRRDTSSVVPNTSAVPTQNLIKEESNGIGGVRRQRSMVKPERARTIDRRKFSLKKDFMKESVKRNYSIKSTLHQNPIEPKEYPGIWSVVSTITTFYLPEFMLKMMGKSTAEIRQAFREKLTLVTIITTMCLLVGFLTFGLQNILCNSNTLYRLPISTKLDNNMVSIDGVVYNVTKYIHPKVDVLPEGGVINGVDNGDMFNSGGKDLSFLFQDHSQVCKDIFVNPTQPKFIFPCIPVSNNLELKNSNPDFKGCHLGMNRKRLTTQLKPIGDLYFSWDEIYKSNHHLVYNGNVLDIARLDWLLESVQLSSNLQQFLKLKLKTKDISYLLNNDFPAIGPCLESSLKVGVIDTQSIGCISSNIILYLSLTVIISLVLCKFFMALFFGWVMAPRLGSLEDESSESKKLRLEAIENWSNTPNLSNFNNDSNVNVVVGNSEYNLLQVETKARFSTYDLPTMLNSNISLSKDGSTRKSYFLPQTSRFSIPLPGEAPGCRRNDRFKEPSRAGSFYARNNSSDNTFVTKTTKSHRYSRSNSITDLKMEGLDPLISLAQMRHKAPLPPDPSFKPFNFSLAHTLMLVTCYSENESGLRATFDSLALTDYPNSHKLLYVVCDGIITGHGNSKSTPDLCLSMMQDFVIDPNMVQSFSYVALASGSKRHNKAKVYAGYYKYDDATVPLDQQARVPMVLVVKVGTAAEATTAKPGNRGKRDGQIILMAFLQRIMFDERLSELDFEMFNAMWNVTGVPPDSYEIVLMVDADTKVYHDSLSKMVAVMVRDPSVMGLCGETKIANKSDSWVTMIQVFEYYISHHLSKAFESVFGGVTCLPGCFCMYRIKAPKGTKGYWVPILANADIVENYSENVVDTLHKKNLLLLGEDRYLTTLMLKTFPKRKMVFVPQAVCKTVVPDQFNVLLSQRRRWINSTVHNLLELVLIRDLCGTFCFSMQFVIFMELVGTVVLPAAISFTLYLLVISFIVKPAPIIPLLLLAAILGLPAVLITFTTRKMVYVGWMFIYLLSLPIWNFVLPVYAYWHFDDFSWGETRKVEGELAGQDDHGSKEGEFDASHIIMKRWSEFERDRRIQLAKVLALLISPNSGNLPLPLEKQSNALDELGYLAPNAINQLIVDPTPLLVHLAGEKDELSLHI